MRILSIEPASPRVPAGTRANNLLVPAGTWGTGTVPAGSYNTAHTASGRYPPLLLVFWSLLCSFLRELVGCLPSMVWVQRA